VVTLIVQLAATWCLTEASASAEDRTGCDDLFRQKIENVNLHSSASVPAQADLPAYCRVLGVVRPAINFEVRLPMADWNGKFYMAGCGGFCGMLQSDLPGFANAMNFGLRRHYAVSTMDSGHWGSTAMDGRWAFHNRVAEADFAWRAVTETARVTRALIAAFYGAAPRKSYFGGCSTGGRMAAIEAQRFPNDFDGLIAGAPALDYTGLAAIWNAWIVKANAGTDGKPILNPGKVKLIGDAVVKACGNPDRIVDDPAACAFQPSQLRCRGGDRPDCLTAAEVSVIEKWYAEPRNSKGDVLVSAAVPRGSESFWPRWLTGEPDGTPARVPQFARDFLRYMAFPDDPGESHDVGRFDFDRDPARMKPLSELYNATNPDLTRFRDRGGKLIMYHGWADAIVPPGISTAYWTSVTAKMGGAAAVSGFYRLFMVPGFDHCGFQSGPGITQSGLDPLTALENWVEKGMAPDVLVATRYAADGKVERARPICPYPQVARFKGGDANDPANYACVVR
jgi:feruloyl esterase